MECKISKEYSHSVIPALNYGTADSKLHTELIGETCAGPGYRIERAAIDVPFMQMYISPHPGDEYEPIRPYYICATQEGHGILSYRGNVLELGPGSVAWLDMNEAHLLRTADNCDNWHFLWMYFNGISAKSYYNEFINQNHSSVLTLPSESMVKSQIKRIISLYENSVPNTLTDLRAETLIADILLELIELKVACKSTKPVPEIVIKSKEFIIRHYSEKITLDVLSREFNMDKYYLQKQFKIYIDMSPNAFLLHIRIQKAKELLCNTAYSIGCIAEMTGMTNSSYFISQFKALEGITPAKYRMLLFPDRIIPAE